MQSCSFVSDHGIQLEYMEKQDPARAIPEKLFVALECLLDDPVDKVKTAAAITLYTLNRPCKGVGDVHCPYSVSILMKSN